MNLITILWVLKRLVYMFYEYNRPSFYSMCYRCLKFFFSFFFYILCSTLFALCCIVLVYSGQDYLYDLFFTKRMATDCQHFIYTITQIILTHLGNGFSQLIHLLFLLTYFALIPFRTINFLF